MLGEQQLSILVGLVVYVLVLVPVVIAALEALQLEALTAPASSMLDQILAAVPQIFAAVLILFIAFLIGKLVADLVSRLLAVIILAIGVYLASQQLAKWMRKSSGDQL